MDEVTEHLRICSSTDFMASVHLIHTARKGGEEILWHPCGMAQCGSWAVGTLEYVKMCKALSLHLQPITILTQE
jgi:hypothetical protein